jgi:hypothetical protein
MSPIIRPGRAPPVSFTRGGHTMAFHANQKVEEIGKDAAALAVLKAMGIT